MYYNTHHKLKYFDFFKATFLESTQGSCLKNESIAEDMMPEDGSVEFLSFDDQCKYAFGEDYKKYNGRYQGNEHCIRTVVE